MFRYINENVNLELKRQSFYCWSKILKASDLHEQYLKLFKRVDFKSVFPSQTNFKLMSLKFQLESDGPKAVSVKQNKVA